MKLVWCLTRTLSQHQVNQEGGTLPVHLLAQVVLGHDGVEGLEHDQADTAACATNFFTNHWYCEEFSHKIFWVSPQAEMTVIWRSRAKIPTPALGNVWTISEQRREELGPASLRLEYFPAFSKPNILQHGRPDCFYG